MNQEEGIRALQRLEACDDYGGLIHEKADEILLKFVPDEIRRAYEKLKNKYTFYYD